MSGRQKAQAFAPASIANCAVGFDVIGFPIDGIGDQVTVSRLSSPKVEIKSCTNPKISLEAHKNTAGQSLLQMIQKLELDFGFLVEIEKNIPLSSGMGGSASSAVGAVLAANALLDQPLNKEELLPFCLAGEAVASGAEHADNVAPSLFGGINLTVNHEPISTKTIPHPEGIWTTLVHPQIEIETKEARNILNENLHLSQYIRQLSYLAGFICGCYENNLDLIRQSMIDLVVEPQRSKLIPGFNDAKRVAMEMGAIGFSISGSGPSVFAWSQSQSEANEIGEAIQKSFSEFGIESDLWISMIDPNGARLLD